MTIRVLLAAIAAGLIAGFLMTPIMATKVVPVILSAEEFETGTDHHDTAAADQMNKGGSADTADDHAATESAAPVTGVGGAAVPSAQGHSEATPPASEEEQFLLGRFFNTLVANLVTGAGYGLLLAGISLAAGVRVTFTSGLAWGFGGWLCSQLLPALGLPPELPGFPSSDLVKSQIWWVATVALSVAGFWLLFLYKSQWFRALGVVLLVAPHAYGAPKPEDISSVVPAYLASQFATASLAATLFFWLVLGLSLGWLWDRVYRQPA